MTSKKYMRVTRGLTADEALNVYLPTTLIPSKNLYACKMEEKWIIVRTWDDEHIRKYGGIKKEDKETYRAWAEDNHDDVMETLSEMKPIAEVLPKQEELK